MNERFDPAGKRGHPATVVTRSDAPTDPDAFLKWASERPREEGRFELSKGVVTQTMINVTRHHARVCRNIVAELSLLLDPKIFDVATADFAVRSVDGIRGPDIVVDRATGDGAALATEDPLLLVEVLSPSSYARDFVEKLEEYTNIPSLQTYLICSQDEPRAWVWARTADGSWPGKPEMLEGRDGHIALAGLAVDLTMAAIFRGIPDRAVRG
jgi:Uma2 family endonuclease